MAQTTVNESFEERIDRLISWFPFGKAPLLLLIIFVLTGTHMLLRSDAHEKPSILMWTFAISHRNTYVDVVPSFEKVHPGKTVEVQLVQGSAIPPRLRAAFWTDLDVPDLVEIEITRAGSFFRGPPGEIGFLDLTPYLDRVDPRDGVKWKDKIVDSRLAPYRVTKNGRTYQYGLPHDVHPVMIAYRADLLEPALRTLARRKPEFARYRDCGGDKLVDIPTWDEFAAIGRELTKRTELGMRYMCEMNRTSIGTFEVLMFQADSGYFDESGQVSFDNDAAVEAMMTLIPMVAGPDVIAEDLGWGAWSKAVEDGTYLCWLAPDWRSKYGENHIQSIAGKVKLMPVPAIRPGGRRTSTWGGTMIGISKQCAKEGRADLAWELALHLYINEDTLSQRFHNTNILPPFIDQWKHPVIDEPNPYYANQKLGRLYADLGEDVPPQYASPFIELAKSQASVAVTRCANWYDANHDEGPEAFEKFVRMSLKEMADTVRRETARNPF